MDQLTVNRQIDELDNLEASNESLIVTRSRLETELKLMNGKERLICQIMTSIECFIDGDINDKIREKIKKLLDCYRKIIRVSLVDELYDIEREIANIFYQ